MNKLTALHKILFLALFLCLNNGVAFAGGGDGSEVLGPVKDDGNADKGTLMDSVKKMLSGDGKGDNDADSGDKSSGSGDNDGEQRRKPGEARADNDKNSDKDNSKNKNSKDGDSDQKRNSANGGGNANSKNKDDGFPLDCVVTPSVYPDHIPVTKIKKGNNLMRKPGSARRANGQYVQIVGKVVDEDCVPISDAEVQIWQTDAAGKYEDEYTLKTDWEVVDKGYDKNFGYTGAAQTNNLGEFSFLTILPAMKDKEQAPHINFYVRHPDFRQAATMMFFDKHPKNDTDKNLKNLPKEEHPLLIAQGRKLDPKDRFEGRVYGFMITLGGVNKFRRY